MKEDYMKAKIADLFGDALQKRGKASKRIRKLKTQLMRKRSSWQEVRNECTKCYEKTIAELFHGGNEVDHDDDKGDKNEDKEQFFGILDSKECRLCGKIIISYLENIL